MKTYKSFRQNQNGDPCLRPQSSDTLVTKKAVLATQSLKNRTIKSTTLKSRKIHSMHPDRISNGVSAGESRQDGWQKGGSLIMSELKKCKYIKRDGEWTDLDLGVRSQTRIRFNWHQSSLQEANQNQTQNNQWANESDTKGKAWHQIHFWTNLPSHRTIPKGRHKAALWGGSNCSDKKPKGRETHSTRGSRNYFVHLGERLRLSPYEVYCKLQGKIKTPWLSIWY